MNLLLGCYIFILNFNVLLTKADFTTKNDCHCDLPDLKPYLASKSPYRFVANTDDKLKQFDGCQLEKIIGFIRHGTRTASHKITNKMKNDLPKLRDEIIRSASENPKNGLCNEILDKLSSWEFKGENNENEKWLTREGEDEMVDLAERFQKRFPQILTQDYSNSTYYFKYTASQRAEQSAKYFALGLFGRYKSDNVKYPESLKKDPILRFYKLCDKWLKTVKKNPRALINHFEFITGEEITTTCETVSRRLGLNYTLTYDDVHLMYQACSFETAWNKSDNSPWCFIFSEDDLEVLAYGEDLKLYLRDGYGHNLNYQIACPAVRHIFKFFDEPVNNVSAVFYFTHSGTILKLLSHLGLYKDSYKLSNSLNKEERSNRRFKTSYIDAFASNLVFASYICGEERKILTLHQEKPVQLPGCLDGQLCSFSNIKNNFKSTINDCDFDKLCSIS